MFVAAKQYSPFCKIVYSRKVEDHLKLNSFSQRSRRWIHLRNGDLYRRLDRRDPLALVPLHRDPRLQPKTKAAELADVEITVSSSD